MINEFDSRDEEGHSKDDGGDTEAPLPISGTVPGDTDAGKSQKQQNNAQALFKPAYQWLRSTAGPWITKRVVFSSSFWTAAATVAIAFATIVYTHYARKQWEAMNSQIAAMQQQLKDTRIAESARLVIEFTGTATQEQQRGQNLLHVQGSFKVRNVGSTIANEINIPAKPGTGASYAPPNFPDLKPSPNPNGPSLAPNGPPLEVPFDFRDGGLGSGGINNAFVEVDISVSYRDIFADPHIVSDCHFYFAPRRILIPCPSSHQHE